MLSERQARCLNRGMEQARTVIVHSLGEATAALADGQVEGQAVVLLSAPGAALYAGCGWWHALVAAAQARYPEVSCTDILDCADGSGQAMAALRIGLTRLVLWPDAPGRDAVRSVAESMGGFVLAAPPPVDPRPNAARPRRGSMQGSDRRTDSPGLGNGDKARSPG